jgi:alanine racemase
MRTWAEVSEGALVGNIAALRARLGGTRLMGVVKANAYGHGAVWTARILEREGAAYLAVATLDEAVQLREAGLALPILIFGVTPHEFTAELLHYNITQTVADFDAAKAYSDAAASLGKTLKCHIKLDTGMARLGFSDVSDICGALSLPALDFEGVFTHFAVSDTADGGEFTRRQFGAFRDLLRRAETLSGKAFRLRHCANSGATLNYPETYMDMARPGILLYGYPDLTPVMEVKSRVVSVRRLPTGETVSYGRKFTAGRDTLVAVLPVGYADGLRRTLSGGFEVLLNGRRAPQIGTICMDMCMVDVTNVPNIRVGDTATVFGRAPAMTARELADLSGTIPYEVLCAVSARVPRVYVP